MCLPDFNGLLPVLFYFFFCCPLCPSLPLTRWLPSQAVCCRSETVDWKRDKTPCWQRILMRVHGGEQSYLVVENNFLPFLVPKLLIIVFSPLYIEWQAHAFTTTNTHSCSLYLPLAFFPSFSLHTDTNIPKCGLTANATAHFLLSVLLSDTKQLFKNMTFLKLMLH